GGRRHRTPGRCTASRRSAEHPVTMASLIDTLLDRIREREARVGVIGLGYVGLPLAVEFARAGYFVTGFDVDAHKAAQLNAGKSYIPDVPDSDLSEAVNAGKLRATTDMHALGEMDAID